MKLYLCDDPIEPNLLFPFYIKINRDLKVMSVGKSLSNIMDFEAGLDFAEIFEIIRPRSVKQNFDDYLTYTKQLFIIKIKCNNLTLRGQMVHLPKTKSLVFFGSPWITDANQLIDYGLSLHDFALNDSITDMLQVLKLHEINTDDIKTLANDLKQQKHQIELKEKRYRLLVENASEAILRWDVNGEIKYANPATTQIFGYEEHELVGRKFMEFISEEYKEEVKAIYVKQIQNEEYASSNYEYTVVRKDGSYVWLSQNTIAIMEDGQLKGFTSIARDITERKLMEKELIDARQKALESMNAKERFLANTSHEIRTPMNAIMGLSSLLKDTILNDKQQEFVSAINNSSKNLLVIINDILDISKIESGKLELEHISFDLKDKLDSLMSSLQIKASEKNLFLKLEWDEQLSPICKGDPFRINQILVNLLGNALKFTQVGSVKLKVRQLASTDNFQKIEFKIEDTGLGIPKDKLDSIFEDFSQVDSSITRKYGGTGLGLSISKKLAEMMKGNIKVKSVLGEGSVFSINLILERGVESEIETNKIVHANPNTLRGKKILLVEDNEINQFLAVSIMEQWNLDVTIANNGLEAIKAVQDDTYEVVLMDIQMPEMGGMEATAAIRKMGYAQPIIAMTANAMKEDLDKYLNGGMDDYITKPFERDDLFDVLTKATVKVAH